MNFALVKGAMSETGKLSLIPNLHHKKMSLKTFLFQFFLDPLGLDILQPWEINNHQCPLINNYFNPIESACMKKGFWKSQIL